MAREIRDKDGNLIGTVRSTHPILNAFAILFGISLIIYAVSGTGVVMWIAFACVGWVVIRHFARKQAR